VSAELGGDRADPQTSNDVPVAQVASQVPGRAEFGSAGEPGGVGGGARPSGGQPGADTGVGRVAGLAPRRLDRRGSRRTEGGAGRQAVPLPVAGDGQAVFVGALEVDTEPRFAPVAAEGTPELRLLPEATRWLLLIELAACDPFAPFEFEVESLRPMMYKALSDLASTLDVPSDALETVRLAYAQVPAAMGKLPQLAPGPATAGLDKAAGGFLAPVLRGRDLVGWAGWSVAGGLYMAREFDRAPPVTATAQLTLPSWRDRALASAVAGAVVAGSRGLLFAAPLWPLAGVAVGRFLERRMRRQPEALALPDLEAESRADVADFLLALGPQWAKRELGKLAVTVDVVIRPRRRTDSDVEPCPDVETILAALRAVAVDLDERLTKETRLNDPEMPQLRAVREIMLAVADTALAIAGDSS